jgi:hypothetical protein
MQARAAAAAVELLLHFTKQYLVCFEVGVLTLACQALLFPTPWS